MMPWLLGWGLKCPPVSVFVLKEGAATMLERGHEAREVLEERGSAQLALAVPAVPAESE